MTFEEKFQKTLADVRNIVVLADVVQFISDHTSGGVAEVISEYSLKDRDVFLAAFANLVVRFDLPDIPAENSAEWSASIEAELFAQWDFDYYQVSLVLRDGRIILAVT